MAAKPRTIAVAWFRREDYQRIREISDDEMIATFEQFEAKMTEKLARLAAAGIVGEKMIVDPDQLLTFAKAFHAGKVNANVRAEFAARLFNKQHGSDH